MQRVSDTSGGPCERRQRTAPPAADGRLTVLRARQCAAPCSLTTAARSAAATCGGAALHQTAASARRCWRPGSAAAARQPGWAHGSITAAAAGQGFAGTCMETWRWELCTLHWMPSLPPVLLLRTRGCCMHVAPPCDACVACTAVCSWIGCLASIHPRPCCSGSALLALSLLVMRRRRG